MLLAYNRNSPASGGCHDQDCGLTTFGREVVAEMDRVGMVLDLTHVGWNSAAEAMAASRNPVVFSHSNAHAIWSHGRNIPDSLIRDCAAGGGVIGINGINIFLGPGRASLDAWRRHLDHMVALVGPAHVALGFDWVPPPAPNAPDLAATVAADPGFWPPGNDYDRPGGMDCLGPQVLPRLRAGLKADGWAEADIAALFGGNMRRIAEAVWPRT
jgi:membrane dipeptidase